MNRGTKESSRPNDLLRYQRQLRGWTQEDVARQLHNLCQDDRKAEARGEINAKMIGSWERGEHVPSPYYQNKLRLLFDKTFEELGFIEAPISPRQPSALYSSSVQQASSAPLTSHQAIDFLCENIDAPLEQQLGAWLALSIHDLAPLFEAGWAADDVIEALQFILKGGQAMAALSRRKLLQLSASTMISSISLPTGKQVSATQRLQLHGALGESIGASWKLLQTARTDQLLAVGHAQLYLVQQSSAILPYSARPNLFSSVYRLIGAALHFQGRYDEAYQALEKAQLSALDGMDTWNMVQSRMWQIDGLKAQGMYPEAIEMTEAALRLISLQNDQESIRTKAHLLTIGAECAALTGDVKGVQSRLEESEKLLEHFSELHEEFDRAFWHQLAGVCALHLNQNEAAIRHFQHAREALPAQWLLRHALTLMPLVIAYARLGDRETALVTAEQAIPLISSFHAPSLNKQFTEYTSMAFTEAFAGDVQVNTFLADIPYKLISPATVKAS